MIRNLIPSRRDMLKGAGALVVSLPISNRIGPALACTDAGVLRTIDRSARIAGEATGSDACAAATTRNAKVVSATYEFAARDYDASGHRPMLADLRASVDTAGNITAWDSESFVPSGYGIENPALVYRVPSVRTVCHQVEMPSYRASWMTTPDHLQSLYARECFMDELASAAGIGPVEFRLQHLDPAERGIDVLRSLVALSGWAKRTSAAPDANVAVAKGRGISLVNDEATRSVVGTVCEVAVNRRSGEIDVLRVHIALARGKASEVALELIERPGDRPDERFRQAGHTAAAAALLPAISNALFNATGVRLRSVPFTPEKLKAATKGSV